MANYLASDTDLTSVANAIRTKGGTSAQLAFPAGFVQAINDIPTGGGGGGLELLVDDTAAEDVATINLVIPQGKQSLPAYVVVLNGETSAKDYIYPELNSTSGTGSVYFPNIKVYSSVCFAVAQGGYGGGTYYLLANNPFRVGNAAISNIFLRLYNASSRFTAGFNIKVYGVSL